MNKKEYLQMVSEVNRLRNEIHIFNNDEIGEAALDDLKHKITIWENEHPKEISPNSPNYTIAGGVLEKFEKASHKRRMLSLNDIFNIDELSDWEDRWKNHSEKSNIDYSGHKDYICEPKIDGLALSLHYNNGELISAITRGDSRIGELVTKNALQIKSIPTKISFNEKLEIRGEVFFTKDNFEKMNQRIAKGEITGKGGKTGEEAKFSNPRNAASGTIRQLDSSVISERNLSFIAYGVWKGE